MDNVVLQECGALVCGSTQGWYMNFMKWEVVS